MDGEDNEIPKFVGEIYMKCASFFSEISGIDNILSPESIEYAENKLCIAKTKAKEVCSKFIKETYSDFLTYTSQGARPALEENGCYGLHVSEILKGDEDYVNEQIISGYCSSTEGDTQAKQTSDDLVDEKEPNVTAVNDGCSMLDDDETKKTGDDLTGEKEPNVTIVVNGEKELSVTVVNDYSMLDETKKTGDDLGGEKEPNVTIVNGEKELSITVVNDSCSMLDETKKTGNDLAGEKKPNVTVVNGEKEPSITMVNDSCSMLDESKKTGDDLAGEKEPNVTVVNDSCGVFDETTMVVQPTPKMHVMYTGLKSINMMAIENKFDCSEANESEDGDDDASACPRRKHQRQSSEESEWQDGDISESDWEII